MSQSVVQLKVLIAECLDAETELAKFLVKCAHKYGHVLSLDETFKGEELLNRTIKLVEKIQASDDSYHPNSSDGELPEPTFRSCGRRRFFLSLLV
jgi:hypothetical protein